MKVLVFVGLALVGALPVLAAAMNTARWDEWEEQSHPNDPNYRRS